MARDARETKMHYSPSEKDGVFVVEVARGADSGVCNGTVIHNNRHTPSAVSRPTSGSHKSDPTRIINDDIEVHPHPAESGAVTDDELLTVDEDGAVSMSSPKLNGDSMRPLGGGGGSTNTGLSQSDLSISTSCGSNGAYTYGTQTAYSIDPAGYQTAVSPQTVGLDTAAKQDEVDVAAPPPSKNNSKPIIMAAIFKQESVDPGTSYPEDGRPGKLRTDKNAAAAPKEERQQLEEQRLLGNGLCAIEEVVNGVENGKEEAATDDVVEPPPSGPFDSLISLPAPPTIDEIKQLNDISLSDNNNMDSLPPPPPPEVVVVDGPAAAATDQS